MQRFPRLTYFTASKRKDCNFCFSKNCSYPQIPQTVAKDKVILAPAECSKVCSLVVDGILPKFDNISLVNEELYVVLTRRNDLDTGVVDSVMWMLVFGMCRDSGTIRHVVDYFGLSIASKWKRIRTWRYLWVTFYELAYKSPIIIYING